MKKNIVSFLAILVSILVFIVSFKSGMQRNSQRETFDVSFEQKLKSSSITYREGNGIVVVQAMDYQCPPCHGQQQDVESLLNEFPEIAWKVIPLRMAGHKLSNQAILLVLAGLPKGLFAQIHKELMTTTSLNEKILKDLASRNQLDLNKVSDDYKKKSLLWSKLEIPSTPSYFASDGNDRRILHSPNEVRRFILQKLKG